ALFGHAATAPPRWLTAPAVALHAAGFIFWIGALPWLAEGAAAPGGPAAATLRRFSALAVPLVAGIVLSGAVLAVVQVGRPSALIATAYGRLLLAKLALVGLLLLLAALNRFRLTPAIARGDGAGARAFRRSVTAEILLGLFILVLASGFRLTPPPRALALAVPQAAHAHAHGATAMADVTITPGRAGANVVEIFVTAADFGPLDPLEVGVAFSDPERGVEPIRLAAVRDGTGGWRAGPVQLPHPGRWTLTLDILVSDFAKETLGTTATIGR
ncbi:MAG TPA: CopD family protein, partial [Amaricoccus sp.]|nr:CopD family protein [Amaricoccus sp.]